MKARFLFTAILLLPLSLAISQEAVISGFAENDGAILMQKQADGTFSATIEFSGDTLAYKLVGVDKFGSGIAGTQADCYTRKIGRIIDGAAANFVSVVKVKDGRVNIKFDPAQLPRSSMILADIQFAPKNSRQASVVAITNKNREIGNARREAMLAHQQAGGTSDTFHLIFSF